MADEVNVERFAEVASACDALLLDPLAHPAWLAAPFLHPISAHPVLLGPYRELIDSGKGPCRSQFVAGALRHIRNLGRSLRAKPLSVRGSREIILVSGLVDPKHLSDGNDFYFGGIQRALAERGVSSLLLLRNQTGIATAALSSQAQRHGVAACTLLPDAMDPRSEASFIGEAIAGARAMRRHHRGGGTRIAHRVRELAERDLRSPSTTGNLRLERQIQAICLATRPRVVMAMYEGHAWERCVWRGARRADPSIRGAGYQHTVMRKSAHAMRRRVGGLADPDIIFCLGDVTRDDLAREPALTGTEFVVIGTHRRVSRSDQVAAPVRRRSCIVLPEGMPEESVALFGAAAAAARSAPDIRFIFRCHPVLPFEKAVQGSPELATLPPNVEISTARHLDEELARSGWMLYRGSSSVLYGILAGIKPFYLERMSEVTLDPIYALNAWRESVSDARGLLAAFARDDSSKDDERLREWRGARDFCDKYALPEQPDAMDRLASLAVSPD